MQKYCSIYLDLVRFAASLGVFLAHLMNPIISGHVLWWRIGMYAEICVTIFFVLSGYVISFVTSERENSWKTYFISRISRLYSVVLPALILTYIFDSLGQVLDPELYTIAKKNAVLWKPENWVGYLSSMFFVNEFTVFNFGGTAPGTNGPFWSLSF